MRYGMTWQRHSPIAGFPTMEAIVEERAPLHRHLGVDDVGAAAAYLLSDEVRNVTGTTL